MANTYVLIASNTLSSSAATVTFSSIPGTYTDLLLKWSARSTRATAQYTELTILLNNSTAGLGSGTVLIGTGSAAQSTSTQGGSEISFWNVATASGSTANTFANGEIYIPSYAASQGKVSGSYSVSETNATAARMYVEAGLWRSTDAVTTVTVGLTSTHQFASGSSFWLYGIKNS